MKPLDLLLSFLSPTHITKKFSLGFLDGLFGGGSSVSMPAADPAIGEAQKKIAEVTADQWNTFKTDTYPELMRQAKAQEARAQAQYDLTSEIVKKQQSYADQDRARYEQGAIPAMEKLRKEAEEYDTEANRERMAQAAKADIGTAYDTEQGNFMRRQQAYGIDPTSGATQFGAGGLGINKALMEAQAMNQTRQAAKEIGLQKTANVYNMYAGLPAQGNTSTGIALGASNQGIAGGQTAIGNTLGINTAANQSAQTANQGWGSMGQLGVSKYGADISAFNSANQAAAASSAGFGQALGTIGMAYAMKGSDIRIKQDVIRVGQLDNGLNLYSYQYLPEYRDTWGHGPQIGVMAHEVEKVDPTAVFIHADGYKVVNYAKVMNHGA
jgi:hypothetical protein